MKLAGIQAPLPESAPCSVHQADLYERWRVARILRGGESPALAPVCDVCRVELARRFGGNEGE